MPALPEAAQSQDIWITEFGWATGDDFADVSVAEQSQYMETALRLIQGWDDVRTAIAYRLFDDGDALFGLLNGDEAIRSSGGNMQGTPGNSGNSQAQSS